MRLVRTCIPWVAAVTLAALCSCSDPADVPGPDPAAPRPVDFRVVFPANLDRTQAPVLSLLITGRPNVSGTVESPGLLLSEGFLTDGSGLAVVSVPSSGMLTQLDAVESKGIRVHADDTVCVVAVSDIGSPAVSLATCSVPPESFLGTDYRVLAGGNTLDLSGGMYLAVVATADTTTVTITPATAVSSGRPAGTAYSIVLGASEAYQTQASALAGDITGTRIQSDKPIAVYAGHMCATIPGSTPYAGFLVAAVPPVGSAGSGFFAVPLAGRSGYWLRVLALEDGTALTYSSAVGGAPAGLEAGQFADFRCTAALGITSTRPVIVAQMAEGASVDSLTTADPFLGLLAPVSRFDSLFVIATPSSHVGSRFVNLVVATPAAAGLTVNGTAIGAGSFSTIGSTGYSQASIAIAGGLNTIASAGSSFGAFVYGWAPADGYNGFCFTPGAGF